MLELLRGIGGLLFRWLCAQTRGTLNDLAVHTYIWHGIGQPGSLAKGGSSNRLFTPFPGLERRSSPNPPFASFHIFILPLEAIARHRVRITVLVIPVAMDPHNAGQTSSFPHLEDYRIKALPNGAYYIPNFITEEDEEMLLRKVEKTRKDAIPHLASI